MHNAPQVAKTARKVTTFAAPPKDFNPLAASAAQLAVHGIPRKPDAATEPGSAKFGTEPSQRI